MKVHCLFDKMVPVHELKPHPKNMNKHPKEQIERLAKILEYQGFRYPIKVSKQSGFITSGHGRLEAAKLLKATHVPVNYQGYVDEAQEYADIVADNAIASWSDLDLAAINHEILSLPDFDIDLLGIEDFKIVEPVVAQCDEDSVPEQVPTVSVLGDLYELGEHRLLCSDSTSIDAVEKLMNGEKADMVFTDPPYGIGFKYNSHQDTTGDEYMDFCRDWFHNIRPLSDFIIISTGWAYNKFWYSYDPDDCFYWLSRNKRTGGSRSHFRKVEPLFIWGRPKERYDFDFFEQTSEIEADLKGKHSCPKPVSLIQKIIEKGGDKVLDIFGGSGTTLIACQKTGRKSYLLELDPRYVDVIVTRYCKYTGNNKIKRNGEEIEWQMPT